MSEISYRQPGALITNSLFSNKCQNLQSFTFISSGLFMPMIWFRDKDYCHTIASSELIIEFNFTFIIVVNDITATTQDLCSLIFDATSLNHFYFLLVCFTPSRMAFSRISKSISFNFLNLMQYPVTAAFPIESP